MVKTAVHSICAALLVVMLFTGSAFGIDIDPLSLSDFKNLIPTTDVIGKDPDELLRVANGTQGVDGIPFFLDANGVPEDDDDPIAVGDDFYILLGPATDNDTKNFPSIDIDALLMMVTFDISTALTLLPVSLSESGGTPEVLNTTDFHLLSADLGLRSGGGGMSFNPADNDLVGAFLITDPDFNAGVHTNIGTFTLSAAGFTSDYISAYRVDLFGVDLSYDFTSPSGPGQIGEIVSAGSNSSGGYLVPEPGSFAIIGSLLVGLAWKKRFMATRS